MRGWNEAENKWDEDYDWDAYTDSEDEAELQLVGLLSLPSEVLELVASFLPLSDITRFARVAKGCQKIVDSQRFWALLLEKDFGVVAKRDLAKEADSEETYRALLRTEFTADFTVRQIERVGFRDIRVGMGARYDRAQSHWLMNYPAAADGDPNVSCDFDLALDTVMSRAPHLGLVVGIVWAAVDTARLRVDVNGRPVAKRVQPPRTPENKRLPLTGGGEQSMSEFHVPTEVLRLDAPNRVSIRYLPDGGSSTVYIRRMTLYPVMRDTIRRETSRRKTITIVRSVNC